MKDYFSRKATFINFFAIVCSLYWENDVYLHVYNRQNVERIQT